MKAINPATEELIRDYPETNEEEIERALRRAAEAFSAWGRRLFAERAEKMLALAAVIREETAELARVNMRESGKPIVQAENEVQKCAWVCEYFAEYAEQFLLSETISTGAMHSEIRYEPMGPLLAIMPWNFPFWQFFRAAVPAIMAGNVVVVKHASNVPGTSLAIGELFGKAGFPAGVVEVLLVSGSQASALIGDGRIRGVTVTGSEGTGRKVAGEAGRHIKKTVLELGGSDPFLVLDDADIVAAARLGTQARTLNAGQSCTAAKRFLVEASVAEAFEEAFVEQMRHVNVGDPSYREVEMGPLARQDLVDDLHDQVRRTVEQGATVRTGGEPMDRQGYFYPPTVLTGVEPGMAAFEEETFGPVAAITRAEDRQELIELANRSRYGLAATIVTANPEVGRRIARELETGAVFVNSMAGYDPRLPMGGRKVSGYGRELSHVGLREFVYAKTVSVEEEQGPPEL